jgi:uncharacterized damage-inducible protein DinB
MERPAATEHIPYYSRYIDPVPEGDVLSLLADQVAAVRKALADLPEARGNERYAPGKWTVKEMLLHVVDTERIFAYRACCIARGETQTLSGYDQDAYAARSEAERRTVADLVEELALQRQANLLLLRGLSEEATRRMGSADGDPISVRALVYILAGHVIHHLRILRESYGIG